MISGADLKEHLDVLAKKYPKIVVPYISQGDLIQRGGRDYYEIDDVTVADNLAFQTSEGIYAHFEDKRITMPSALKPSVVPFSTSFAKKQGLCLEHSIVAQLVAQKKGSAYLINGVLAHDGDVGVENHAYNIVFNGENPYLLDVLNPLRPESNGDSEAFLVRIQNVIDRNQEIILPTDLGQGRVYSIF